MEKINIAELLKNCPKGMELDCLMYDNVTLDSVSTKGDYPIKIVINNNVSTNLTKYGQNLYIEDAKCVIFPKGKRTWDGFQKPFKDGDIIFNDKSHSICIFKKEGSIKGTIDYYCGTTSGVFYIKDEKNIDEHFGNISYYRLATEVEKQKLFDVIKANGYKWSPETNTLKKLIELKFKIGDKIEKYGNRFIIAEVKDNYYLTNCGNKIPINNQDDYKLVPNKFDISTLKPFDKVLTRDTDKVYWSVDFYSHYLGKDKFYPFVCIGGIVIKQCIPYEENKHLLGTTNDCDDYYKTW